MPTTISIETRILGAAKNIIGIRETNDIAQYRYRFYSKIISNENKVGKSQQKYKINTMTICEIEPSPLEELLNNTQILDTKQLLIIL